MVRSTDSPFRPRDGPASNMMGNMMTHMRTNKKTNPSSLRAHSGATQQNNYFWR